MSTAPSQNYQPLSDLAKAINQIRSHLPQYDDRNATQEGLLLRTLLNRLTSRLAGDDGDYDYWGVAAHEHATAMLELGELPAEYVGRS